MAWVVAHALEGAIEALVLADADALASPTLRRELELLAGTYLRR